jgi:hypothetical protein
LIAAAAMAGIYAAAATSAASVVAGFSAEEGTRHTRVVAPATAAKQASVALRAALATCTHLAGTELNACHAEAETQANRAVGSARRPPLTAAMLAPQQYHTPVGAAVSRVRSVRQETDSPVRLP